MVRRPGSRACCWSASTSCWRSGSILSADPAPIRANATARTLAWIALSVLAILVVHVLGDVLLVVFAASLLAVLMQAASRFVARHTGMGRRAALGALLALVAAT